MSAGETGVSDSDRCGVLRDGRIAERLGGGGEHGVPSRESHLR